MKKESIKYQKKIIGPLIIQLQAGIYGEVWKLWIRLESNCYYARISSSKGDYFVNN